MFSVVFLLALLAFSVTGSPVEVRNSPITLPMTRRLAFSNITDLLRNDEARLAAFGQYSTHGRRDADIAPRPTVPLSHADLGGTLSGYTVKVGIGNPVISYNLIVDSASAITWVGAGLPYLSQSGVDTGVPVAVNYGWGSFQGTIFRDQLNLDEEWLTIHAMRIGVASSTSEGFPADGVLGIGPTSSSLGALPGSPGEMLPTVTDRLRRQGSINFRVAGIFFQPIAANEVNHGELCFGGTNPRRYTGYVIYTPTTTTPSTLRYWGINQRITYGQTEILAYTAGVVDSGCTFLYLARDAYDRYKAATGGTLNENGLLQISAQQYISLRYLKFHIGTRNWKFSPNAQIWPRSLNYKINGDVNDIFLIVKALGTPTGAGCDFVNGYVFLQRFYTVFDSDNSRVGFARTEFTDATTN